MYQKIRSHLFVIFCYLILTFIMTYPLVLKMETHVHDLEDSLLNTWILSWNIHRISSFNFINFFDANIFFPHKRVLAYSEHMFSNSLVALPVMIISGNPILSYNVTLLFSFLMSAVGMYFLANYLTNNKLAAFLAGIIFAFSPFNMAHLFHLQVISAWGIPLSFDSSDRNISKTTGTIIFYSFSTEQVEVYKDYQYES